ncbi:MAG: metal-dependent hydrolase [Deltaproteobacteria bacterium]|nr:metal-dependent hydrolase [Deltaproteobacteria bacterium]
MILGHFAFAGIAKQTFYQRHSLAFLVVVSYLPDLLDKPGSMFLGLSGRGVGHSLIVFGAVATLAWFLSLRSRIRSDLFLAAVAMWFSHLAGDFLEWGVLLWPFLAVPPKYAPPFDFLVKIHEFYVIRLQPEQLWLEIFCVVAGLMLLALRHLPPRLAATLPSLNWSGRRPRQ